MTVIKNLRADLQKVSKDEEDLSEQSFTNQNIESYLDESNVRNLDESLTSEYTNKTVKDITMKDYEAEIARQNAFLESL